MLDDCARLREVIGQLQTVSPLRYTPALVVLTWADVDGPDAAQEFGDMVRALPYHVVGRKVADIFCTNLDSCLAS